MAYYYRMMRDNESNIVIPPSKLIYEPLDYIYSNEMPSHNLYNGERVIYSLSKSPEAAIKWAGPRGKGMYNRLAYYDFDGTEGEFYDLTDIKTWVSLIHNNKNGLIVNNINGKAKKPVEAIRIIVPCMRSAISMAKECEEVIFIPHKKIEFNIVENYDNILRNNPDDGKSILTSIAYDNSTIEALLNQLEGYNITRKSIVQNQLMELMDA